MPEAIKSQCPEISSKGWPQSRIEYPYFFVYRYILVHFQSCLALFLGIWANLRKIQKNRYRLVADLKIAAI